METAKTIFAFIGLLCSISFAVIMLGIIVSTRYKNRINTMKVKGLK